MSEPGWYADYENPQRLRYFDGAAWTEHVRAVPVDERPAPPATEPTESARPTEQAEPGPAAEDTWLTKLFSFGVIGLLVGMMFGGFLFNGIGSITPVTEYRGVAERIEIDYSRSTSSTNREFYVVSGSSDGGDWRIVSEEAYRALDAEGYPQDVVVAIGSWTNSAERVVGDSFVVDHQSTGARVGWAIALGVVGLGCLGGAVLVARAKSGGAVAALYFLLVVFVPGTWLGYQAFQWIQSP